MTGPENALYLGPSRVGAPDKALASYADEIESAIGPLGLHVVTVNFSKRDVQLRGACPFGGITGNGIAAELAEEISVSRGLVIANPGEDIFHAGAMRNAVGGIGRLLILGAQSAFSWGREREDFAEFPVFLTHGLPNPDQGALDGYCDGLSEWIRAYPLKQDYGRLPRLLGGAEARK